MASPAAMTCPKIMQRPAAATPTAPTEVVCETSSTAARGKGSDIPTILQKKGENFVPTISEKEEKNDDNGIVIMKPGTGQGVAVPADIEAAKSEPPSSFSSSLENDVDKIADSSDAGVAKASSWNPLEEVDSALLSALCDTRERKALFRLEQVIVEFMKDKSSASMEVGGAFNSIVLNQNSGGGNCSNSGEVASDRQTMSAVYQQGLQDLQYQQQRGLRQTSFQRLILHRLADRFSIIREQINGNELGLVDVGSNNLGQPSFSPGLIRLVKTNESSTPPHLLIDIDLSLLINYKNPRARNYGGINNGINSYSVPANTNNYDEGIVKNLMENMAVTSLESPNAATIPSSKRLNKKMVIMKRNSSSASGSSEGKGKGKQKGKSRRKKLEDREKAYEEARKRIFGIDDNNGGSGGDDNVEKGEGRPVPQSADAQDVAAVSLNSCHSSLSAENDVGSGSDGGGGEGAAEHLVPSQLVSSTPSANRSSPPPPEPQGGGGAQGHAALPPRVTPASEVETSRHSFSSSTNSVPAAVTSGAVFKAVYRNRQQEENDPDFKRRSDVRPSYVPYVPVGNPYGAPVGYGIGPAAASPPSVPAVAMMALHAPQQHQFYSQPSAQFPTPQDAAAVPYTLNKNVANGPPPQWAAAPPRGYYPPPQQQGHQEKHPQAWQPRSNGASQVQQPGSGSDLNNVNNYGAQFNAPTNNSMNSSPSMQQPSKVLWGPGAQQGDVSSPDMAASRTSEEAAAAPGGKDASAVYKPEDFPALG